MGVFDCFVTFSDSTFYYFLGCLTRLFSFIKRIYGGIFGIDRIKDGSFVGSFDCNLLVSHFDTSALVKYFHTDGIAQSVSLDDSVENEFILAFCYFFGLINK